MGTQSLNNFFTPASIFGPARVIFAHLTLEREIHVIDLNCSMIPNLGKARKPSITCVVC